MTEELPLPRAHLEEAEVLPVAGVRLQAGLAPGDLDGLVAVTAEDVADRPLGRERGEPPGLVPAERLPQPGDVRPRPREEQARSPERRAGVVGLGTRLEQPAPGLEETHGAAVAAGEVESALEAVLERAGRWILRSCVRAAFPVRCRKGLCREQKRTQANE